jgi:transcription elongation factor GreA
MKKILLTKEGKEKLEAEYQHYVTVLQPNVIRELSEARAQGDLSENADYDAAKKRQSEINSRIAELEAMLRNCEIISSDNKKKNVIKLGSKVKILDLSGDEETEYTIVGTVEADPFNGRISYESLLATSILGAKVGDRITVKTKEPYEVEILSIEN